MSWLNTTQKAFTRKCNKSETKHAYQYKKMSKTNKKIQTKKLKKSSNISHLVNQTFLIVCLLTVPL